MVLMHALVARIRQQQGIGMQQEAAVLEERKIMLLTLAHRQR